MGNKFYEGLYKITDWLNHWYTKSHLEDVDCFVRVHIIDQVQIEDDQELTDKVQKWMRVFLQAGVLVAIMLGCMNYPTVPTVILVLCMIALAIKTAIDALNNHDDSEHDA